MGKQIGLHDAAPLPSQATVYPKFLRNCATCSDVRTTTCHKVVVWVVSKGMLCVKYYHSRTSSLLGHAHFMQTVGLSDGWTARQ